jgi:type III secretion system YscD/HrpQ family protein
MPAKLIATEDPQEEYNLTLEVGETWIIGRDPDICQLVIEDSATSREHARCTFKEAGYALENLSDTNPVTVNDLELSEARILEENDIVKIGSLSLRFTKEETSNSPSPKTEPEPEKGFHDDVFDLEEEENDKSNPIEEVLFNVTGDGRWLLKSVSGPNNGAEFSMEQGESYVIGTDASRCDIIFQDLSISREHARITIDTKGLVIIEDLGSRNGTLVDQTAIDGPKEINSSSLCTLGTSSFMVIDTQEERHTIVPPPLSSFGQVSTSTDTVKAANEAMQSLPAKEAAKQEEIAPRSEEKTANVMQAAGIILMLTVIAGIFIVVGLGTSSLFESNKIVAKSVDSKEMLAKAFIQYPQVRYTYNKASGKLFILGHVLTANERSRLLYNLSTLHFITSIDDNIVIDEFAWQQANPIIAQNPKWRNVTIQAPSPGRFVMTGQVENREEGDLLTEFIALNFLYPELLENRVIIVEEIKHTIETRLSDSGLLEVTVDITLGEVTFSGRIPQRESDILNEIITMTKKLNGVRVVKNFVVEQKVDQVMVDLTDQYEITGYSSIGNMSVNVVINGKILTKGDSLDGMEIIEIKKNAILLKKDGFRYKINYNE